MEVMILIDRNLFLSPPKKYRSLPFWSWNDKLDSQELVTQIDAFDRQGIGGFFMHSREGLETKYLGDEWADAVKTSVDAAKKRGMYSWIYDEDRWPSGAAGGRVTALGNQNRAKAILIHPGICPEGDGMVFYVDKDRYRRLTSAEWYNQDSACCYTFRIELSGPSEWFNNDTPANNLNPDCVSDFLSITYEKYKDWVGDEFGKTVAGFFTDEPNFSDRRAVYQQQCGYIPYTEHLEERFRQEYGYDLFEHLPALFFDYDHSFSIRHDFWRLLSILFTDAYTHQIFDWCDKNGLQFTGHFLYENDLGWATRMGGAVMPHYRYEHVPGIDMLCDQSDEFLTILQCVSVARQMGRPYVISEMYGCTGWDFDFAGQRRIGDWQFALGVNLRCQHLALYSLKGCRKRDFPPCFNYNTSWWKKDHLTEDYFARLTALLTQGSYQSKVLVLHPQSTAWGLLGTDAIRAESWDQDSYQLKVNQYGYAFNDFLKELSFHHIAYDLGDEQIIAALGRVENGKLLVGCGCYDTVVIKQCQTVSNAVYRLLIAFIQAGGKVYLCDDMLVRIDGKLADLRDLLTACESIPVSQLLTVLAAQNSYQLEQEDGGFVSDILVHPRQLADENLYFIVNHSVTQEKHFLFTERNEFSAVEYDCLTGKISDCPVGCRNGRSALNIDLRPGQSVVIGAHCQKGNTQKRMPSHEIATLSNPDAVTPHRDNVLVLDICKGVMGDLEVSGEVWQVQRRLREELGLKPIWYNGQVQRYKWIKESACSAPASLIFPFYSETEIAEAYLAVEQIDRFRIYCNGIEQKELTEQYFLDRSIGMVKICHVCKGKNEIALQFVLDNPLELENIYLLGKFGVSPERRLTDIPRTITLGDYTVQGYYHYTGEMEYRFSLMLVPSEECRYLLKLTDIMGANVEVSVNGIYCGDYPWAGRNPIDITDALQNGSNDIVLIHTNTPRNVFGPFHDKRGKIAWTDWQVFRTEKDRYSEAYEVVPNGLFGPVRILEQGKGEKR